jgi:hypothetical protein
MIIQTFDSGWQDIFPAKRLEQRIVNAATHTWQHDSSRTVVINSVWYTDEYHQQVMSWLKSTHIDRIVLVAMLDAAIPQPHWFQEIGCEIVGIGYYPGANQPDYWSLFVDTFMTVPDTNLLMSTAQFKVPYMCLNRKPHPHRVELYQDLDGHGILDSGLVSLGSESGPAVRSLPGEQAHDRLAPNHSAEHHGIPNDIASLGNLDHWHKHFLNIVTETTWDISRNGFVSEKIYKPIVGGRPFLVYDPGGAEDWLVTRGFKTFLDDFRDISELDLRNPKNIAPFLSVLSQQNMPYLISKYLALRDKIQYNKTHFQEYVQQQRQGLACLI